MRLIQTEEDYYKSIPKIDFSSPVYVDDFLPPEEFETISNYVTNSNKVASFPYFPRNHVADPKEIVEETDYWNWYGTHILYDEDIEQSDMFPMFYESFVKKFKKMGIISALIRIKANFYPWTENIKQHGFHTDFPKMKNHYGALFSINTCDGYTEFLDGTKIDSVANRMMFFNPSVPHRSTTTTTDWGRFNINFNFL
tara:strand:+ start:780 stop:1370 length:591 start_codon:yes stop_codon:yes gene_type:complete